MCGEGRGGVHTDIICQEQNPVELLKTFLPHPHSLNTQILYETDLGNSKRDPSVKSLQMAIFIFIGRDERGSSEWRKIGRQPEDGREEAPGVFRRSGETELLEQLLKIWFMGEKLGEVGLKDALACHILGDLHRVCRYSHGKDLKHAWGSEIRWVFLSHISVLPMRWQQKPSLRL